MQHVEAPQRQHARGSAEQAPLVGRHHGQHIVVHTQSRIACRHQLHDLFGEQSAVARRCLIRTAHVLGGHLDQGGHQVRRPLPPGHRPGSQAVRLGHHGQQLQELRRLGGPGDRGHGERVVEVAPGRDVGQQQVVLHEAHQRVGVVGAPAAAPGDGAGQPHAGLRVIAGVALADVMQQRPHHQQVGACYPVGEAGCGRDGLEQVPVHREAVVAGALGAIAVGRPLGQHPRPHVEVVERLDDVDGLVPAAQQLDEERSCAVGPRVREVRLPLGQLVEAGPADRHCAAGRLHRCMQHQHDIGGGVAVDHQLAVAHRQPGDVDFGGSELSVLAGDARPELV